MSVETTYLGNAIVCLLPALMFGYLAMQPQRLSYLPWLTVLGITSFIVLDKLRQAAYWSALAFGADIAVVTDSTQVIYTANISLALFLLFAWHERNHRTAGS